MTDTRILKEKITQKLKQNFGKSPHSATPDEIYKALSLSIRDEIIDLWAESNKKAEDEGKKRLYYLSAEFLIGRSLGNNLMNLGLLDTCKRALEEMGLSLPEIEERESDAALGNGGLGRLAACFLDSLSTLNLPAVGCGIRYEYGLFRQRILEGEQVEVPDNWLETGEVWQIERPSERVEVRFGGHIEERWTPDGLKIVHRDYQTVYAVPYDMPIVGYNTRLPATLRLWSARAVNHLNLEQFNRGDYLRSAEERELAETISKVLYPENNHYEGKVLRLKQFYFLCSATMQSIVRHHKERYGDLHTLPDKICVQINDTHPALSTVELIRILLDEEGFSWEEAYKIATSVFNYTNHTVMAEALETWQADLLRSLLPRIYTIIDTINVNYIKEAEKRFPHDIGKLRYMSIIEGGQVKMANLCVAVCRKVNGVSMLHGEILKKDTFRDFYMLHPHKFEAITNGITPRRWLKLSNSRLCTLIEDKIGPQFITSLEKLKDLEKFAYDTAFLYETEKIKHQNKEDLSAYLLKTQGVHLDPHWIFDVQAKRLHEYKRQLLKVVHILHLYNEIVKKGEPNFRPCAFIFAAKAAPGYTKAKNIIRLINAVSDLIERHPVARKYIKVVFLENYGVSSAQKLIPAADISEQISTAGREASGTGNMKFMLSGALTLGTLDGANMEMQQQVGSNNIYIFGATVDELRYLESCGGYRPGEYFEKNPDLRDALSRLIDGSLQVQDSRKISDIYHSLLFGSGDKPDRYYLLYDFDSYDHVFAQMVKDYENRQDWNRKAVHNIANAGFFSSDRTISEYNRLIWNLESL